MTHFDSETGLVSAGGGVWTGEVHPAWNIGDNPNGGYLTSLVTSALRQLGPHPDPLSITTHFLRPGTPAAPCRVETEVVRSGRMLSTLRGRLVQDGKARLEVTAAFGDLSASAGVGHELTVSPPDMLPPEECVERSAAAQGVTLPLLDRLDIRLHPDHVAGGMLDHAETLGWIRFTDDRPQDSRSVVLCADAFPPSVFGLLGHIGWVPTIELTVHVRRRPAQGWLLGRFTTSDLVDGRMIEDGMLWDSAGVLVAQSRQIGLLLDA